MPPEKRSSIVASFIGDRLVAARGSYSQKEFAELVGISRTQYNAYERGNRIPSDDALARIATVVGVSPSELLSDLDSQPTATDIAANITPVIRPLITTPEDISEMEKADEYFAVPLLDGKVAAGPGGFLWEQVQSLVWVYRPEIGPHLNLIAVRVSGDSMRPTIPDGAIVIIDLDRRDPRGDCHSIWAIRTDREEALAVKRLQAIKNQPGFMVLSDNFSDHPPEVAWTCEPNELVVGKVVWMWRTLE